MELRMHTVFMSQKNTSIQLSVRADSNERVNQLAKETGMAKVELMTRVFDRFAEFPEEVQKAMIGVIPKSMIGSVLAIVVGRMAREAVGESAEAIALIEEAENLLNRLNMLSLKSGPPLWPSKTSKKIEPPPKK